MKGDLTRDGLGIAREEAAEIRASCDVVLHLAADTSMGAGWSCDETNRAGTQRLAGFVRTFERDPLVVVLSTAYVAGAEAGGLVREERGRTGGAHLNAYTRSKADAEAVLESGGIRHAILRPSLVVAPGTPGRPSGILRLARAATRVRSLPLAPDARLDALPLSLVADALVRALTAERVPRVLNISAGAASPTIREVLAMAEDAFGPGSMPRLQPGAWSEEEAVGEVRDIAARRALAELGAVLPFVRLSAMFDNTRLLAIAPDLRPRMEGREELRASIRDLAEASRSWDLR